MAILKITVENADELLNTSMLGAGALGRVERSATGGGSGYSEITTFALVSGTRLYTVYDVAGAVDSWYRVRFSKSDGSSPSAYGDEFQAGDETGGLLCSLYDVVQEIDGAGTTDVNRDETIIEKIRQVSRQIENYCGRWFAPRPLSGTTTYRFHTESGYSLHIPRGIRSITTLGIATEDQPDSGGTYTTATSTDYFIDPPVADRTDAGDPGVWVRLRWNGASFFYDATFGAQITGAFGYAAVPPDIQGVAVRSVVRRYLGKGNGGGSFAVGPSGTEFLLPDMSGADRATLEWYKRR